MAHDFGKRVSFGFIDIADDEFGGIHAIAATHARNDGNACRIGAHNETDFTGHGVYGIHDVIVGRKTNGQSFRCIGQIKDIVTVDRDVRIDVVDSFFGSFRFVHAKCTLCGNHLSVEIGEGDGVVIKDINRADAAPRQGLDAGAADAARAEDGDTFFKQSIYFLCSEKQFHTLISL